MRIFYAGIVSLDVIFFWWLFFWVVLLYYALDNDSLFKNVFVMEDQISASSLALKAYSKLLEVDPENALLRWMDSEAVSNEEFINEFWDKEEPWQNLPGSMVSMRVEINYFFAVKNELFEKFNIIL